MPPPPRPGCLVGTPTDASKKEGYGFEVRQVQGFFEQDLFLRRWKRQTVGCEHNFDKPWGAGSAGSHDPIRIDDTNVGKVQRET